MKWETRRSRVDNTHRPVVVNTGNICMGHRSIRMAAKAHSRRDSRRGSKRGRANTTGDPLRASEQLKLAEIERFSRKTISAQATSAPVAETLAVFSAPLLDVMPLESAFRLVLKHMPSNRRRGYYPSSFYRNPLLLVSMEMKADTDRYMAQVPEKLKDCNKRRTRTAVGSTCLPTFSFRFSWLCCSPQDDVVSEMRTTVHGPTGQQKAPGSVRMPPNRRDSEREISNTPPAL